MFHREPVISCFTNEGIRCNKEVRIIYCFLRREGHCLVGKVGSCYMCPAELDASGIRLRLPGHSQFRQALNPE